MTFTRLSELKPEQTYNWLNSQLLTWPRSDGQVAQGILYTPEDFDPARKYPVIFNYYDLVADDLHVYTPPRLLDMDCEINVPSYVSRGYVVFKPDIYYAPGELRRSAVTAVLSAAEHLKQQPWVDAKKMAIAGCSFGGIATNSIVTSTGLFAAAASASGIADLVSAYGSLWVPNARAGASGGASLQSQSERGQERMAGTLWDRPGAYVENSAIFHVDQVTTPILMMHTRDDAICPFPNAIEFFTALRRLGKTAWMLQYNDGNHTLAGKSAADFSVRMAQFFDHYLRDAPPPKWMTQGIPARLKGVETGLELDIGANTPGPGLATPLPTQEIRR
ncbi:MAG: S9 family peptidase [Steroidobacter sp.]|nr:S9 family peptidase [Steroidobacter sp.]